MQQANYEVLQTLNHSGISFTFRTAPGGYHPLHWHEELEILYSLNGNTDVTIDSQNYKLPKKQFIVLESCVVHSSYCHDATAMFLCIHISKKYLEEYMPAVTDYQIDCNPNVLGDDKFPEYLEICKMFETMTRIYIEDAAAFSLEAEGIILQVFARLIRNFSRLTLPEPVRTDLSGRARIRHVISYVEEHFMEPLSLSDISAELGIGREYFCRFFKKNMGISFLNYLNEVRLTHVYQDLTNTDLPIAEIMENNGITNQKFFNKAFRKLYGCTPSAVRTAARTASPMENSQVNIALK